MAGIWRTSTFAKSSNKDNHMASAQELAQVLEAAAQEFVELRPALQLQVDLAAQLQVDLAALGDRMDQEGPAVYLAESEECRCDKSSSQCSGFCHLNATKCS